MGFLEKRNNFHPSIKFTCEYSREKINFLDVQVIVRKGKLITDLYVKKTDSHLRQPFTIMSSISL